MPACNLCGSRNARILFHVQGYPVLECAGCGLAFTGQGADRDQVDEFYRDEYYCRATDYAGSLKQEATSGNADHEERVRIVSRLARRPAGRVLDVGCAAGGLLNAFRRAGWQCCGIEPSAELAAFAREVVGCEVHQEALETAALPPGSFDAVTACHVLEHSPDPRRFLECCHRLLKEGGALLVEVPDFGSPRARKLRESWLPLYPDTHLYHFTNVTLTRLLKETGFSVARFRRYGGLGALASDNGGANGPQGAANSARVKARVFETRRLLYRVPFLKRVIRYTYWHLLRMNDYISACAIK